MKTLTGQFEVHHFKIPFSKYNKVIPLIPFGDIHRSSDNCAVDKWHKFLDWGKSKKNCYFIGTGDYDDLVSAIERDVLSNSRLHDSTNNTLDQMYRHYSDKFYEEIKFMKGRLLGLIEGNHYGVFNNGTTTTQYLCDKLGCKYLGCNAFVRVILDNQKGNTNHKLDIWVHHGKSGSRKDSGSLSKLQDIANFIQANIYIMGHDHKKIADTKIRLKLSDTQKLDNLDIVHEKYVLVRAGSFLKGYVKGRTSYVTAACLPPADLGIVKIEITPERRRVTIEGKDYDIRGVDLHASI